jgi:uncharacterized protein YndB with AHSA1/START domain
MSTRALCSAVLAALALTTDAFGGSDPGIQLVERPGHITEARIVVDAPPQQVYDLLTDYPRWQAVFTDVLALEVRPGGRERAEVRFKSRALDHWVTVKFDNIPGHVIRFKSVKTPLGTRARGEYRLMPLDGGTRTQITAWVYLDVVGAPGLFVRDKTIRGYRRAKVAADVRDVQRRFAKAATAGAGKPGTVSAAM